MKQFQEMYLENLKETLEKDDPEYNKVIKQLTLNDIRKSKFEEIKTKLKISFVKKEINKNSFFMNMSNYLLETYGLSLWDVEYIPNFYYVDGRLKISFDAPDIGKLCDFSIKNIIDKYNIDIAKIETHQKIVFDNTGEYYKRIAPKNDDFVITFLNKTPDEVHKMFFEEEN